MTTRIETINNYICDNFINFSQINLLICQQTDTMLHLRIQQMIFYYYIHVLLLFISGKQKIITYAFIIKTKYLKKSSFVRIHGPTSYLINNYTKICKVITFVYNKSTVLFRQVAVNNKTIAF